jgi:hypothetical protein
VTLHTYSRVTSEYKSIKFGPAFGLGSHERVFKRLAGVEDMVKATPAHRLKESLESVGILLPYEERLGPQAKANKFIRKAKGPAMFWDRRIVFYQSAVS